MARFKSAVPDELQRIVTKCLSKDPQERYQNAIDIAVDLKRLRKEASSPSQLSMTGAQTKVRTRSRRPLAVGAFFLLAVVVVAGVMLLQPGPGDSGADRGEGWQNSIAVLPFRDFSPNADQEYFCDGMTDAIIGKLSSLEGLKVISLTSVMRYKNEMNDLKQIGQDLEVDKILEGSIQKDAGRVRINAQLIDVKEDAHLWSKTYDSEEAGIFDIQDEISHAVVDELKLTLLTADTGTIGKKGTENIEAYNLYTQGQFFWNERTREGSEKAIEYFQRAIAADSSYALAYAGLADAYVVLSNYLNLHPLGFFLKADTASQKALALDPNLAEANAAAGLAQIGLGNPEQAERYYKRAIELNPGYAFAHFWYAQLLYPQGRLEEGEEQLTTAYKLNPLSVVILAYKAEIEKANLQWQEAVKLYERALEIEPSRSRSWADLGLLLAQLGNLEEGISHLERALELDPYSRQANNGYNWALLYSGKTEEALERAQGLHLLLTSNEDQQLLMAICCLELERYDEAREYFESEQIDEGLGEFFHKVIDFREGNEEGLRQFAGLLERDPETDTLAAQVQQMANVGKAVLYQELDDPEGYFESLRQAIDKKETAIIELRMNPLFSKYRDDPRTQEIYKAANML